MRDCALFSGPLENGALSRFFPRDQIQRAAVSIMSNIAEGFERAGRAEFHQFLVIAKGSCADVRSQLYIALDIGYISKAEFDSVHEMAIETGRIIGGLRSSLKKC